MESKTNEIIHQFDIESRFAKADLESLKDSKNGYLTGKCFYVSNIQYFIRIYPNGDSEKHQGETWIYLKTCDSKEIVADFTIFVESAEFVQSVNDANTEYKGFGISCCKTAEFFDCDSKFFVNEEITVKFKGTFKNGQSLATDPLCPISMEWKIKEEDLKAKKETNELLCSEVINVGTFPDVKFFLSINPNEEYDENEMNVEVHLNIIMKNGLQIKALYDISVDSAKCVCIGDFTFERPREYGRTLCSTNDLFNPIKKFIVDGYFTLELNGILTVKNIGTLNSEMECSSNYVEYPFDKEWKFLKSDLMDIKDQYDACLQGKCFYAPGIPGFQYYINVLPNGSGEQHRGETWIFLYARNGSKKQQKISSSFEICVESANFSENLKSDLIYNGWGEMCCKTSEFFRAENNQFFVNGEITVRVKGIFKTHRSFANIMPYPILMQWKIKEEDLSAKKESNGYLRSKRKIIELFPETEHSLSIYYKLIIYANETRENCDKEETSIYLYIENEKQKKIKTVFDFNIDSVNYNQSYENIYEKSGGYGGPICSTDDLFDSTKKYIIDGFLTVNLNGIIMIEKDEESSQNELNVKQNKLDFAFFVKDKDTTEDFVIIVRDREIPVHKQKLMDASPAFVGMFNSGMKETIESKMVIKGFPFEVVDAAVSLLYHFDVPQNFALHDLLLLYQFGEKYEIKLIMASFTSIFLLKTRCKLFKDQVEGSLIKEISPANVCQLEKFSVEFNISKLHQSCIEFLIKCSSESTPVYAAESLDKDVVYKMFLSTFRPVVDTDA